MDGICNPDLRWIRGFTNKTVEFVDNETVCYLCGNHICFLNLETKLQSVFRNPGRGVGALTACGSSGVFAFSEEKLSPSIFVYIFPELQLKHKLKGTAELDYTSLALSDGGPYLGCCSSLPHYTITVWNWEIAEVLCTQPQAGQGVISLMFNPLNWFQLCALSSSSLTIWNIEKSNNDHILRPSIIAQKKIPDEWNKSYIINVFKDKGDSLDRSNYRVLKLIEHCLKVIERVMEKLLHLVVDIDEMQFGFVPDKGTNHAIFILCQIQEKHLDKGKHLYIAFVDLEKAFDWVPREVLWWAMRCLDVPEWLVSTIQPMYASPSSRVRINNVYSGSFNVCVGVHQGSILSTLLFIIVLEALSQVYCTGCPWEMLYADNVVLISESLDSLLEKPSAWEDGLESKGLCVNMGKTKIMFTGPNLGSLRDSGAYPCGVCQKGVDKTVTQLLVFTQSKLSTKAILTPSAICWTTTSELYVGCAEGFLLTVDPESRTVSVLFDPTSTDATPDLRNSFHGLTLHNNGLIAVGKGKVMHYLQIKGTSINSELIWQLEEPVTTVIHSPNNETLLLSSNTGCIYKLNPSQSDKIVKVLDVQSGNFLAAAFLHDDKNICVSLKDSGELQLWSSDGICLSSLSLQAEVTTLACCPIAHYAAVGTASGNVLFIDLSQEHKPRLVHQVYLYHTAVDHLIFDQEGHYLFTSGSDSHVYVVHAKPSKVFSVIGYTVIAGSILSLSTQCISDSEEVKVLALCAEQEDKNQGGSLLMVISLPATNLADSDFIDCHGCLTSHILKVFKYQVSHPLTSCVLGVSEVFAYCHRTKALQRFHLPEESDDHSSQQVVELKAEQEVRAHPLGPASLALSPHGLWLASVGRDGLLRIRETASLGSYTELQCHSFRLGGAQSVSFSADSLTLVTTGLKDGSLVCASLGVMDAAKGKEAILADIPAWRHESLASTENPEENEVVTGDNERYSEIKTSLRETINELRDTFQEMISENENVFEQYYNLDAEEKRKREAMVELEVQRVRTEIEEDILEKYYLYDVLKREFWDSVTVKGKAIKAFHSQLEVLNYPMKAQTEKELDDLSRVQNARKYEKGACALSSPKESPGKQEKKEESHEAESATLTGSFSAQLGYSNPDVYDQFSLQTTGQRINQIILLQDVIYRIKTAFNTDFEALHRQKLQELNRVRDRNSSIRTTLQVLDIDAELWEPGLTVSETPERLLTVDDSEVKADRYLTSEQQEEEERRKKEEDSRLAAQGDDSRERALDDMMEGVLEVTKEDILKMEIPQPEFALTKSDIHWSEEEKKVYAEYEKKTKELSEEKEKYRKLLEIEIKKLQQTNKEATERFDENLRKLLEKKLKCTEAIYQEELKITYLADSVLREEEMRSREQELELQLEKMLAYKDEIAREMKKYEDNVDEFHKVYDCTVDDDKDLDKNFRTMFPDLSKHLVDQLYKLLKRRPRAQKLRTQAYNSSQFKDHSLAPDVLDKIFKDMEELDASENMPEGVSLHTWEQFCLIRRRKVESEQTVKTAALTLAEMQAFLQRRRDEHEAAEEEIRNLSEARESLHKEKNLFLMDTMVQVILKQGQVEVSIANPTADTVDTDFILYHRGVVDNLRRVIRMHAEQKIVSMVANKDVRKGIIQLEWEHRVKKEQIEDLMDKMRTIKMLRLTKEQQHLTHRSKTDRDNRTSKQVFTLEKSIAFMKKTHEQCVQQRIKKIEQINRRAAKSAEHNAILEQQLPDMQVTVAELRNMCEATAFEENEAANTEERYQEIVQKSNLEEISRVQAQELALLWAEVERLTMKNFPSLKELKYD
ncbi:cilia- and flagella-associated protein 43 [Pholidichthys leucotaenia]